MYGDDGGPATLGTLFHRLLRRREQRFRATVTPAWASGTRTARNGAESASLALSGHLPGQVTILGAINLPAAVGPTLTTPNLALAAPAVSLTVSSAVALTTPDLPLAAPALSVAAHEPFPSVPLATKVELLINGTWTDVTPYVYQRADMVITSGRPDESQQLQQGSCTFTLNNRDLSFSPYATAGQFYPFLTRNTQCRVSVNAWSAQGINYAGYRFWGEVPAWPPVWDVTGNDVTAVVTVSGIMRRLTANTRNIGSALYRYWTRLGGAGAPVAYWPCTDGGTATQFRLSGVRRDGDDVDRQSPGLNSDTSIPGSDGFATLNGSHWTGAVSGVATPSPATYTAPGTHLWTCPGDVTSLTSAEAWGSGSGASGGLTGAFGFLGGGGGAYAKITSVAVTPGNAYTLIVAAGGAGTNDRPRRERCHLERHVRLRLGGRRGRYAPVGNTPGQGGSTGASTGTTKHSGGDGGTARQAGGAGGGGSGGSSSNGNTGGNSSSNTGGSGGSAVTGGGKGGKGGNISSNGESGGIPGGGAGGAGGGGSVTVSGGNGGSGQMKLVYTSTGRRRRTSCGSASTSPPPGAPTARSSARCQRPAPSPLLTWSTAPAAPSGHRLQRQPRQQVHPHVGRDLQRRPHARLRAADPVRHVGGVVV